MLSISQTQTRRAVAYYRHSAEDKQENSVPIQREHAEKFAELHKLEIIHEEADQGVSGLTANRPGFQRLINDWITNPDSPKFDFILVYDVSRWGRFQNQNEPAHYQYLCEKRGIKVVYIVQGFPKEENALTDSILTPLHRFMAADYSRQLSDKVFYGCVKVSEQGFSAGGTACYGMARLLLDVNKQPIRLLKKGEHKQISNERVAFVPLNDETTKTVQKIFRFLLEDWLDPSEIAGRLNKQKIPSANGGTWNRGKILRVLTNETYTGSRIYNKTWHRLKQKMRKNPRSEWAIKPNASPAVVKKEHFAEAQERLYWLMPSRWKRGIYTINKIDKLFKEEVQDMLTKRQVNEDLITQLAGEPPFIFCVRFDHESVPHWCFLIPEKIRGYEKILGVSVSIDTTDPIDKVFLIPTSAFNEVNYLMFSESDPCFKEYVVEREKIENALSDLV